MAVGTSITKSSGRIIFDLVRDGETTTRVIEVPFPLTDSSSEAIQTAVNTADSLFTSSDNYQNVYMQPSNWRDNNLAEEQWTTTGVHYEIITTTTTPIEPDET